MEQRAFSLALLILPTLMVSSCQDESFGYTKEEIFKSVYERNFINKYGPVSPDQTWDFSHYARHVITLPTRASPGNTSASDDGWYYAEPATLHWLNCVLHERDNHSAYAESPGFIWDGCELEVIPLSLSGANDLEWTLYARMASTTNIVDVALWSKKDAARYQLLNPSDIACQGAAIICPECGGTNKGMHLCLDCQGRGYSSICRTCSGGGSSWVQGKSLWEGCTACGGSGSRLSSQTFAEGTIVAGSGVRVCATCHGQGVVTGCCTLCYGSQLHSCASCEDSNPDPTYPARSKPFLIDQTTFSNLADVNLLYFYVKIENSKSNYATKDKEQLSVEKKVVLLECPHPSNIQSDYEVKLMAFEEQTTGTIDNDFNDLAFLLVGHNRLPGITRVNPIARTFPLMIEKRYMVEDLGSSSDWDFNDVVADVSISGTYKIYNDPHKISPYQSTVYTGARISWLCGTKPFELNVGSTSFRKVNDPTDQKLTMRQLANISQNTDGSGVVPPGWNPAFGMKVENWNPLANNVSISVWRDGQTETKDSWHAEFPASGTVPYIIATDKSRSWMPEGQDVDWW